MEARWERIQEFPYHEKVEPDLEPTPFLFFCSVKGIRIAKYDFDGCDHTFTLDDFDELKLDTLTHWMPAPPPPASAERRLVYHDK